MSGIRMVWVYANNIIRSARQLVNEELKSLELSSAEGNILFQLLTQGDTVRQETIVEQLDISKPAVSRALDTLEQKGYVTREKVDADKRVSMVMLTSKAHSIRPRVESIYNEMFAVAARGLSDDDIRGFVELFGRVSENFSQARKSGRQE
jgi:DNA-binding MarR family transcriptional regulator